MEAPQVIFIAGPNGAGKTTFARQYLVTNADCPTFLNADLIAQGVAPFQPESASVRAGKIMLELVHDCASRLQSFALETTFSGRGYARLIPQWQARGYLINIFFLDLPDANIAVDRVRKRVAQGGHDIPEAVIRRR